MSDVAQHLDAPAASKRQTASVLLPLVYAELRKLAAAAARIAVARPDHTLNPTALVHDAYLRLLEGEGAQRWNSRGHFFAAAAEAMRHILIEKVCQKRSLKAGGDRLRHELQPELEIVFAGPNLDILALNDALAKLEAQDKRRADLVKLRFFAGLSMAVAAHGLGVSASTAENEWTYARSWLKLEIEGTQS